MQSRHPGLGGSRWGLGVEGRESVSEPPPACSSPSPSPTAWSSRRPRSACVISDLWPSGPSCWRGLGSCSRLRGLPWGSPAMDCPRAAAALRGSRGQSCCQLRRGCRLPTSPTCTPHPLPAKARTPALRPDPQPASPAGSQVGCPSCPHGSCCHRMSPSKGTHQGKG